MPVGQKLSACLNRGDCRNTFGECNWKSNWSQPNHTCLNRGTGCPFQHDSDIQSTDPSQTTVPANLSDTVARIMEELIDVNVMVFSQEK